MMFGLYAIIFYLILWPPGLDPAIRLKEWLESKRKK